MQVGSWKFLAFVGSIVCSALFVASFSLVVLRGKIEGRAVEIANLESSILNAQDELRALEVSVDDSIQPHVLRARIEGQLALPVEGQVVRVRQSEIERLEEENRIASGAVVGREGV